MMNGNEDKGDLVIKGGKVRFGHLSWQLKAVVVFGYVVLTFWAVAFLIGVISALVEV